MIEMRNILVIMATLALTITVIGNAYVQKKQFYPSVVYITKSNPSMAVIYLQALIMIWLFGKLMQKIFFGDLRAAEIEHLIERFWYAITETCLAFTVFKDDFSPKFIALFALLLFLKTFHWLAEDRVDYMERSPIISWLFHARIVLLLVLLGALDVYFITFAYHHTLTKGASVQLVFGFEYAILLTVIVNTAIKYVLHIIDMNREVFWENKAVFLLHVEVLIGLIKVGLYMIFVALMIKLYTLPLFAFRPMYYSMRNFKKALNDVIQSRRAIRNMNTLYPDATVEELAAADNVCIICREEMQAGAKKLPCNHIFHVSCLRSWFQRHQTCPTCRLNVLRSTPDGASTTHATPPPQPQPVPQQNHGIPPLFAFPAWQPPFFPPPPMPNANIQNTQNADDIPRSSQAQQQQPQASRSHSDTGSNQSTTGNTYTDGYSFSRQFPFPFMIPPIPSFIPGFTPPPLPPQNWSGLSVEELRQMEDSGRRGVEARLQCLRNIHTLMDASVILMQQYITSATIATTAAASSSGSQSSSSSSPSRNAENEAPAGPATSSSEASTSQTDSFSKQSPASLSASSTSDKIDSFDNQKTKKNVDNSPRNIASSTQSTSSGAEDFVDIASEEQEEIRRRRVEKFASPSS